MLNFSLVYFFVVADNSIYDKEQKTRQETFLSSLKTKSTVL